MSQHTLMTVHPPRAAYAMHRTRHARLRLLLATFTHSTTTTERAARNSTLTLRPQWPNGSTQPSSLPTLTAGGSISAVEVAHARWLPLSVDFGAWVWICVLRA
eukprot:SAG31_NODE_6141_length_2152_cov_1.026790_2_plen_103_part_00